MLLLGCTITCVCVNVATIFLDVPLLCCCANVLLCVGFLYKQSICVSVKSSIVLSSYNLSTFSTSYLTAIQRAARRKSGD